MAEPSWRPCWFDSSETGAPVLNNVAGSLLNVLRGCLINGFNTRSVTSIVVASGIATATAAGHGYSAAQGKLLLVEGAPDAGLNGRVQPLSVTTNNFTYACPGVADGTYTGTITAKRAPLGWTEPHTGAGKAIFARSAPEATATLMRVQDTKASPATTTSAFVSMVDSATDVDTVTGEITANGNVWRTGSASATAQPWVLVGDERGIWFTGRVGLGPLCWFGDPELLYPADANGCFMAAGSTSNNYDGAAVSLPVSSVVPAAGIAALYFRSSRDGATSGQRASFIGPASWGHDGLSGATDVIPLLTDMYIKTPVEIRARAAGLFVPLGNKPFPDLSVQPVGDRQFVAVNFACINGTNTGQVLIDLTGPWRQ